MKKKTARFRILLIEDNIDRVNIFKQWLCDDGLLTVASSAGKAMGILPRDNNREHGRVYSGILLDHDLQEQVITDSDRYLSSTNLIDLIIENIETTSENLKQMSKDIRRYPGRLLFEKPPEKINMEKKN